MYSIAQDGGDRDLVKPVSHTFLFVFARGWYFTNWKDILSTDFCVVFAVIVESTIEMKTIREQCQYL